MKDWLIHKEETVQKKTHKGTEQRSTGKSFVWVFDDDRRDYRHVGWYFHALGVFSGLVDCKDVLGVKVAAELSRQLKKPIRWAGAPQTPELTQEDGLDEFD